MGILDNIKKFLGASDNNKASREDDPYKKSKVAQQILEAARKIQGINSFDHSISSLSSSSSYSLQNKSLEELERLQSSLDSRLSELTRQKQRKNPEWDALEEVKWTGQKINNMTDHDLDRHQSDDLTR